MALTFGWKAAEVRESFWIDDPDLVNVSAAARQAWEEDGDASHLRDFIRPGGKPTRITFRVLNTAETRALAGLSVVHRDAPIDQTLQGWLRAFRLACDFPDWPTKVEGPPDPATGEHQTYDRIVTERGFRMLSERFVASVEAAQPGLVNFYGRLIVSASFATDDEKKASSQPSTPTPSTTPTESPATAAPGAATP